MILIFKVIFPLLSLSLIIGSIDSINLTGYDCTHINSTAKLISLHHVSDCDMSIESQNSSSIFVQIVRKMLYKHVMTRTCKISRSSLITRCGMWSHAIAMPKSLTIDDDYSITIADCYDMIRSGRFIMGGRIIEGIKMNQTTKFHTVDAGSISSEGKCEGVTLTIGDTTYEKVVRSSEYKITLSEEVSLIDIEKNKIILPSRISCIYDHGSCRNSKDGLTIWDVDKTPTICPEGDLLSVYRGPANITVSNRGITVLTVENKLRFALSLKEEMIFCNQKSRQSESGGFTVMIQSARVLPFIQEKGTALDLDTFENTNLKFVYMERHVHNRTTDLYTFFIRRYCELNKQVLTNLLSLARTNPEEFAWVYTQEQGYTGISMGEVIQLIKCTRVTVQLRSASECYNELPVTYNNKSVFLKPASRNIVRHATPVICASKNPVLYKINGIWRRIGGEPIIVPQPTELSAQSHDTWNYGDLITFDDVGYLSSDQIQAYQEAILRPMERQAINDVWADRVASDVLPSDQGLDFNRGLNINALNENLSMRVLYKVYGIWTVVIQHLSGIVGVIIIWDLLWYIINMIINGIFIYRKFGCSSVILTCCWPTGAKHVLYDSRISSYLVKRYRKRKCNASEDRDAVAEDNALEMITVNQPLNKEPSKHQSYYPVVDPLY